MKIITAILVLTSLLFSEVKYTEKTLKVYSSADKDVKYQGKVLPSTKINILEITENKALVNITGWTKGGVNRVLYYSKGKRIISAAFSKKAKFKLKKIKSEIIKGKTWEKVEITTWIDKKNFNSSKETIYKIANDMFESNCTVCHPAPDIEHFTANQWPQIMKDMGARTPLIKEEILLLTQYLQKHTNH